jgi:hypothetical protein
VAASTVGEILQETGIDPRRRPVREEPHKLGNRNILGFQCDDRLSRGRRMARTASTAKKTAATRCMLPPNWNAKTASKAKNGAML